MKKFIIGIDIGGTAIKSGVFDKSTNKFVARKEIKTQAFLGKKEIIKDIRELIKSMISEKNIQITDVIGIGVGSPGIIKDNVVNNAFNFKNWNRTNIKTELQKTFKTDIKSDNDVNIAALGEKYFGAGKKFSNFIMLTLGTGIGGGIIINDNLYTGIGGAAGEIGHIKLEKNGRKCSCGAQGCFEAYASATGILTTIYQELKGNKTTIFHKLTENNINLLEAKHLFDACRLADKFALKILDKWVAYLSIGIANCINFFNPEAIIIGGGLSKSFKVFEKKLKNALRFNALPIPLKSCKIKKAELLNNAGIYGTISLFL
jgi:glucokinase